MITHTLKVKDKVSPLKAKIPKNTVEIDVLKISRELTFEFRINLIPETKI
jgi:hypothetical protein